MTAPSFHRSDLGDQQLAFTGLLAHPLVTPWTLPELFRLITRHQVMLKRWCDRLRYQLVSINQCYRLRRVPLFGTVAVPQSLTVPRRTLVLALLAAAILEDVRQDSITLQEISDSVRRFAAVNDFSPYDANQRRHRVELVEALHLLVDQGVIEQRTQRTDLLDAWEREGSGIGAGYIIHRDALVLLVDTQDAELALSWEMDGTDVDTRGPHLLRRLVETQALETELLSESEADYLRTQRRRLVDQAEEMTGGTVEVRRDAWILVLPTDRGLDEALLVGFPEAKAADWVALSLLDSASQVGSAESGGRRRIPSATVDELATRLHGDHLAKLTVALRESPSAIRDAAERQLTTAGLLSVDCAGWTLLPAAGRYRAARLETYRSDLAEPTLFEDGP